MKMFIWCILFILFTSCNTIKQLSGHTFYYKSKNRKLELAFKNDSLCEIKNTFYCEDIDLAIRNINFLCKYKRIGRTIYLSNLKPNKMNKDITYYIPPQNSIPCYFLNDNNRKGKNIQFIGPDYSTPYEQYGVIPNVSEDTLYIVKNKIVYYKNNGRKSIGFIFR